MASDHWNSLLQLLLMAMRRQMLRASLGQSPHGVPGRQNNGLLLHHGQDLLGHVLLVHHHLVHVLREPVIGHDQVTWGGKQHHSTEPLQDSSHRQASPMNDALNTAWSRWLSLQTHTPKNIWRKLTYRMYSVCTKRSGKKPTRKNRSQSIYNLCLLC